jgi:hypothetical protein
MWLGCTSVTVAAEVMDGQPACKRGCWPAAYEDAQQVPRDLLKGFIQGLDAVMAAAIIGPHHAEHGECDGHLHTIADSEGLGSRRGKLRGCGWEGTCTPWTSRYAAPWRITCWRARKEIDGAAPSRVTSRVAEMTRRPARGKGGGERCWVSRGVADGLRRGTRSALMRAYDGEPRRTRSGEGGRGQAA